MAASRKPKPIRNIIDTRSIAVIFQRTLKFNKTWNLKFTLKFQAIDLLVQDLMPEFSSMLLALLIGGYTIVGGLGGTFYVSYLNSLLLFALIIILQIVVYLNPSEDKTNPLGNTTKMYELVDCWDQKSILTNSSFLSFGAPNEWKFGFNNFFYFFGFIIIDQSNWQITVASKPGSGAVGFIAGGLSWMAISIGLATTSGMAFVALSSAQVCLKTTLSRILMMMVRATQFLVMKKSMLVWCFL